MPGLSISLCQHYPWVSKTLASPAAFVCAIFSAAPELLRVVFFPFYHSFMRLFQVQLCDFFPLLILASIFLCMLSMETNHVIGRCPLIYR